MIFVGFIVGSGWFSGFFFYFADQWFERTLACAGRWQYWQFNGDGRGDVFDTAWHEWRECAGHGSGTRASGRADRQRPGRPGSLSRASTSGALFKKIGARATLAASWRSRASRSLRASSSTVMASMLPFSWNTGSWSSGSVWLMVGIKRLVTKSVETYNENVHWPQAGSNRCRMRGPVFTGMLMDRPRFRATFFRPRFSAAMAGLGLLWLVTQLPYRALLAIGRLLGAVCTVWPASVAASPRVTWNCASRKKPLKSVSSCSRKTLPPQASPFLKWP